MLTAAFLVLITIAAMNANRMIVQHDANYYEQEAYRQAGILANELLTEILTKKFDSTVDTSDAGYSSTSTFDAAMGASASARNYVNPSGNPDSFTPYRSSTTAYFDDVDDYDGYSRSATAGNITGFLLTVQVYYVRRTNLNVETTTRTYYKRIVVTVTNTTYFPKRDLDGDGQEDDDVSLVYSTIKAY